MASDEATVEVVVDGAAQTLSVRSDETLLETVREQYGATGVRYCCGIGVCGTCTVLLDGRPVSSCLLLTQMVAGRSIVTPKGLGEEGAPLPPAQQAFVDAGAFQCSYCIPAMTLAVQSALDRDPHIGVDALCEELGGNLCRCGSYPQIRTAVETLVAARIAATDETRPTDADHGATS